MPDILVTSPHQPFTLSSQFKAIFNGYIYCGTVDAVDPSVSQVQIYLANEDGSRTPVAQPLRTNAGGYLVYNGQPAKFLTDSNHSLLVLDSLGVKVWYAPDMANVDPQSAISLLEGQINDRFNELASPSGSSMVGGAYGGKISDLIGGRVATIADLRKTQSSGTINAIVHEYREGFSFGGGEFKWDPDSTDDDNGGTIIAVDGVTSGRWIRVGYQHLDASMFGLPKTGDCLAELQAIEAIQYAKGIDCYFNIDGTYETIGEVNWPWRQETVPAASFKDYKGARLICRGPGVIFKTTSATGADILQLNSVSNFSVIGWPTLTAVLTGNADAGSNGVSVTNGGKNIYCEVEAKDLPFTVKPTYLDGGKAITIQNGASTLLPYQNVKLICRRTENCAYGATADVATQPLVTQQNWYGNLLNVTAIDCYRAAQVSADSPAEGTVPSNGLNMGLDIVVDAINCQQDYVESRGWCVNAKVRTQRNKATASLIGKNPNDSQVFVDKILASHGGSFEIDGTVTSVDYLHGVGGLFTTNGNSQTKDKDIRYSVRYQGALSSSDQVRLIDAGGNTATGCTFNIFGTIGFSASALATAGNSVFVNGFGTLRGAITA
ncbi:MAG: phage tailspike protein [Aeromonadaceae bacterium]